MKKSLHFVGCFMLIFGIWACEQPESPDFQLNHELEVPVSIEKTYPLLGGEEALIDTTSDDFENIFTQDEDGLIRISQEEDFNFGDLADAIPEIDADPTTVNAEVGELELTNFNSGSGNVGSASFQSVTGFSSPNAGDNIPAGSTPGSVNIDFTTDYFESAIIKEDGDLQLTLTNNLGFDVDELEIVLNSGVSTVGNTTVGTEGDSNDNFNHNTTETSVIEIPASTQLSDLNIDITASWDSQEMQEEGENLVVNDVVGQDLIASQVTAAVESQSFTDSGVSSIDQSSFEFRESDHFVELGSGELTVNIDNNIDLGVETLKISFPEIIDPSDNPLELDVNGVPSSSDGGSYSNNIDLSGYKIKAQNGTLDYTLDASTENTQQGAGSETRTINESDAMDAEIDLNNLEISRAEGYVVPDIVLLNDDQTTDAQDNLDIFNENEAEITNIDGINDISNRVSNLTFENPILNTIYNTNLGVNTTVYAIILGTDNKGNREFLTGKDGSEYQVQNDEIPSELEVNGQPATSDQVIKFPIEAVENPDPQQGEQGINEFNASNSSSPAFFSNLPNKIRFIGVANINEKEENGSIVNPVIFDPKLGLDLPLNISANGATFKDTLDADLGDLPGGGDDQTLSEVILTLSYTNALPLDLDLAITMLDENGQQVTRKEDLILDGAGVDGDGYVTQPSENTLEISFSEEELKTLNRTRHMQLDVELNTPQHQAVRIRKDDSITLHIKMKAGFTSTVN